MKRLMQFGLVAPLFVSTRVVLLWLSFGSLNAYSQTPTEQPGANPPAVIETRLEELPPVLRLHLPILGEQHGVLLASVSEGSSAEQLGLLAGDILVEVGGKTVIAGESLEELNPAMPIVVLRRGRVHVVNQAGFPAIPQDPFGPDPFGPSLQNLPRFFGPGVQPMNGFAHRSSAVSSGDGSGRSVSISRAGEQISLEMSSPALGANPIRFQGTRQQIERELRATELSNAAKREVRQTLQQVR